MTNLTFQGLLFLTASHQLLSATHCGDGWLEYENNCYLFLHKEMDFLNGLYNCRAHGGGLLEINDEAEDKWLYFHFKVRGFQRGVWLGVVDAYNDRVFRAISTQKEPTYVKWHAGEPNNYQNPENCTFVWVPTNSWFDADCFRQEQVVCKR